MHFGFGELELEQQAHKLQNHSLSNIIKWGQLFFKTIPPPPYSASGKYANKKLHEGRPRRSWQLNENTFVTLIAFSHLCGLKTQTLNRYIIYIDFYYALKYICNQLTTNTHTHRSLLQPELSAQLKEAIRIQAEQRLIQQQQQILGNQPFVQDGQVRKLMCSQCRVARNAYASFLFSLCSHCIRSTTIHSTVPSCWKSTRSSSSWALKVISAKSASCATCTRIRPNIVPTVISSRPS